MQNQAVVCASTPKVPTKQVLSALQVFSKNQRIFNFLGETSTVLCNSDCTLFGFFLASRKRSRRKNTSNNHPSENTLENERCATNICYVLNARKRPQCPDQFSLTLFYSLNHPQQMISRNSLMDAPNELKFHDFVSFRIFLVPFKPFCKENFENLKK